MEEMSKASFTIAYDGDALRNHSIDVRALAPALLGFGTLFDAANAALNGESAKTKVNVTALESGSFQITFEVVQTFYSHIAVLLSGPGVSGAANLLGLLGFSGVSAVAGVIHLIKKFRGKAPDKITKLKKGMVRLQYGDQTVDIPIECLKLLQNRPVRDSLQKIIEEPLRMDGIESFEVRERGKIVEKITRDEAIYFSKPPFVDKILLDETIRRSYGIVSLAFKDENKWRLTDGAETINVKIEDKDFLNKVHKSEVSFSQGDILTCDMHILQRETSTGLKTDYTLEKVIRHEPASKQIPFDF